jgi:hypothetical protein
MSTAPLQSRFGGERHVPPPTLSRDGHGAVLLSTDYGHVHLGLPRRRFDCKKALATWNLFIDVAFLGE